MKMTIEEIQLRDELNALTLKTTVLTEQEKNRLRALPTLIVGASRGVSGRRSRECGAWPRLG